MAERPVMILAGGTGGHIFPALAVAEVLRQRSIPVVWLGTRAGLEARLVPAAQIPLEWLDIGGLRGKGAGGWLRAPWALTRSLRQALQALRRRRPRSVLGMGGYVAGPGGVAARLLGIPLVVHEQNSVPGLTNRLLSGIAQRVLTGFDGVFGRRAQFVGNPVRADIAGLPAPEQRYAGHDGALRLLVLGGSLGARALNETVPAALARLPADARPAVRHQAGSRTLEIARQHYARHDVAGEVSAFIDDMAEAYAWADLVICRAGALTVAELAAAGLPAVFVPFPHAVDDHQSGNARHLVDAGAARMIRESELTPEALGDVLVELLAGRRVLLDMARRARALGRPDAAARVADICLEVAHD
jgi:UDP-N-acetylglucosamine--N-acetylmuramyl-(pentapeptide) pyrophosphoryl-undecaprenol N-acetylglucosamine transferase